MGFDGIPALTNAGYTLASIDYRLAPQYKMPAMIQDVKCAVRSFRAHAAEYGIDPERIGVIGASAGGHLAAMLGTTDESAGFDVGEYAGYPSGVQAVVNMAGPVDLRTPFTSDSEQVAESVFGTRDPNHPMLVAASPLTWVSPGDAPFLIIHGEDDQRVPLWQSQALYDNLSAARVPARFIIVKNAGHSIDSPDQSPTRQELVGFILAFFQEYLR
jgi:acetyl esterase/lipase